mmetsp:Transcript_25195/g.82680  ORF Transcript_25195/g.82680 Transcript_25195/m.82680 type:complete len:249 (-) Transcript_25195:218-964(-)
MPHWDRTTLAWTNHLAVMILMVGRRRHRRGRSSVLLLLLLLRDALVQDGAAREEEDPELGARDAELFGRHRLEAKVMHPHPFDFVRGGEREPGHAQVREEAFHDAHERGAVSLAPRVRVRRHERHLCERAPKDAKRCGGDRLALVPQEDDVVVRVVVVAERLAVHHDGQQVLARAEVADRVEALAQDALRLAQEPGRFCVPLASLEELPRVLRAPGDGLYAGVQLRLERVADAVAFDGAEPVRLRQRV